MLKLADFGFSTNMDKYPDGNLRTRLGTKTYMAPEIILGQIYDGRSVDVFSLGVVLFIMVVGHYPFTEATDGDRFYKAFLNNNDLFWRSHRNSLINKVGEVAADLILTPSFRHLINGMLA